MVGGCTLDRIKVLVADDHQVYRMGLLQLLAEEESIVVVGEASDGNEAVERALAYKPDVVIMDLQMPNCNGVEATRRLQVEAPEIHVLMNTVSEKESDLADAIKAGARGYLLKDERPDIIARTIQYVAVGGMILSPAMAIKLVKELGTQEPHDDDDDNEDTQAKRSGSTDVTAIQPAEQPSPLALESYAAGLETPGSVAPTTDRHFWLSDVDLVISPPVAPSFVLGLHKWLTEVVKADVDQVFSSLGADTVLRVNCREATPLPQLLADLPYISEVKEEPYLRGADATYQENGEVKLRPKRYRIVPGTV